MSAAVAEAPQAPAVMQEPPVPNTPVAAAPTPVAEPSPSNENVYWGDRVVFRFWVGCVLLMVLAGLLDLVLRR